MKTLTNSFAKLVLLTAILATAVTVNYLHAAWSNPTATPTGGNIAAPLNTGSVNQIKTGSLTLDGLSLAGGRLVMTDWDPTIHLRDQSTGADDYFLHTNSNNFYILRDSDDNGGWDGRHPARFNGPQGYVQFQSKVLADYYCNRANSVCANGSQLTENTDFRIYRYPSEASSRNISTKLNYNGGSSWRTFYAANKDTADYLCRTKFSRPFGYWRGIGYPSSGGWAPYWNLAIASWDPTAYNGVRTMCTHGNSCYNNRIPYGVGLSCYDIPGLR